MIQKNISIYSENSIIMRLLDICYAKRFSHKSFVLFKTFDEHCEFLF